LEEINADLLGADFWPADSIFRGRTGFLKTNYFWSALARDSQKNAELNLQVQLKQ
jgi:hypothetical protein